MICRSPNISNELSKVMQVKEAQNFSSHIVLFNVRTENLGSILPYWVDHRVGLSEPNTMIDFNFTWTMDRVSGCSVKS